MYAGFSRPAFTRPPYSAKRFGKEQGMDEAVKALLAIK